MKWVPNFDHKPAPVWKPGAPCGFEAAARHLSRQEAMMRQGHRSSLMYKEWKIARRAPPSSKIENCFIAPHMKNVATLSLEGKINFGKNLVPSKTKLHAIKEVEQATIPGKIRFKVKRPNTWPPSLWNQDQGSHSTRRVESQKKGRNRQPGNNR